jgi:hypothetical protein
MLTYANVVFNAVFNALDRLHEYAAGNFLERNSSVWNSFREDFENATAIDGASGTVLSAYASIRIRQHTHTSAYAYVSIRQHTSAYVSIRIR